MDKNRSRWQTIMVMGGAMMASLIGSGFATGQELIQYFVSKGWMGLLSIFVMFLGFAFMGYTLFTTGYSYQDKLENTNDIFALYSNKVIGKFYEYLSIVVIFLTYTVMIAGAGATLNQQFDTPVIVGSILMFVVVAGVVMLGLEALTSILGRLGPMIAIVAMLLGIYGLITNFNELANVANSIESTLANGEIQTSSGNWFLSGLNYVGYNLILFAGFLSQTGGEANSRKDAAYSGLIGGGFFSIAILVSYFGFMASFNLVGTSAVPTLSLANEVYPYLAYFFVIIIMIGIFTTAVTLLWNSVSNFSEDGSKKHKILTLIIGLIGLIIGSMISFSSLLKIVYNIAGYFGIAFMILMLVRHIQWGRAAKEK